jgi:hypothetical protein
MDDFLIDVRIATEAGKTKTFPRFKKNLRIDGNGLYSYSTKIAEIDFGHRTVRSLGRFSATSSRHYNYALQLLEEEGFNEIGA